MSLNPEAIMFYADHPVEFVEDIIRARPDRLQREMLQSVADNPLTSVRSGHGVGKSAVESWLIIWFLSTRPYPKIPCTAPTKHQLYDILWAEVSKWLRNNPVLEKDIIWTQEKVFMRGYREEWFAVARTASKPDALQGFHASHVLYIIDEASGVDDKVFEPILGALTTEGSRLFMAGNPTKLTGFFFDSHHKNRAQYHTMHIDGRDSSRVDETFVQTIIEMFGEDSDVFRVRVAGDFPRALPDSFIPMDKRVQEEPEIYHHNDTMELSGRAVQLIKRYALAQPWAKINVKIDCDGLGVGVFDRLMELREQITEEVEKQRAQLYAGDNDPPPPFELEIYECHFGGEGGTVSDSDPVSYQNSTGLMWGTVREALRTQTLKLWPDDKQISQLSNRKYTVNSNGKIELEKKEAMKKRGLSSPDMGDALALALYESNTSWDLEVV